MPRVMFFGGAGIARIPEPARRVPQVNDDGSCFGTPPGFIFVPITQNETLVGVADVVPELLDDVEFFRHWQFTKLF